jgi:hypothetical protein
MPLRDNQDLDDVFMNHGEEKPKTKRRKRVTGAQDAIRRRAFRVLAILADLGGKDRLKVLKAAERLNRA